MNCPDYNFNARAIHHIDKIDDSYSNKSERSLISLIQKFRERRMLNEFSIPDWLKNGISDRNKKFYDERKKNYNVSEFLRSTYNRKKSTITLYFRITPTFSGGKKTVKLTKKNGDWREGKYYTLQVQFVDVNSLISPKEWMNLSKKYRIEIVHDIIDGMDVRYHSNDASFLWQGTWKRLWGIDSSIHKFPDKPDKGIWGARHGNQDIYLTKHFLNTLPTLKFNADRIADSITKELSRYSNPS